MSVKECLKEIPGLRPVVRFVREKFIDVQAIDCFMAERRIKREEGPIRVGFLCQYLPAWTKVESIYLLMKEDPRFTPFIICVPSEVNKNHLSMSGRLANDALEYCRSHGYSEAVNALTEDGCWLDLREMDMDYIFFSRPYDSLLPACYSAKKVSRYSKICFISYGISLTKDILSTCLNRSFLAYTYYYFSEFPYTMEYNIAQNKWGHRLKLQKSECRGYPMLEHLIEKKNEKADAWSFSKNRFRVLWTPRWTTNLDFGGSNFFEYCNSILNFSEENCNIDVLFRPHPLMFSNFIKTGEMTQQQILDYKQRIADSQNVSLDTTSAYEATLWGTSVFVTDITSMIPEYVTTGKPIIYCASNMLLTLAPHAERLLEGCYIVYNEDELFCCIKELEAGNDPLAETRNMVRAELEDIWKPDACERIMEAVASDCKNRKYAATKGK